MDRPAAVLTASAGVARVAAAAEGLTLPGETVSDEQVLVDTREVLLTLRALEVTALQHLALVDARRAYRLAGVSSTRRRLGSEQLELDPAKLGLARGLGLFPGVAAGLQAGRLGAVAAPQLHLTLGRAAQHVDHRDGLIDGQPAEPALRAVIVDGVRSLVTQARGGFPTDDDPVLATLVKELPAITADTSRTQLQRLEAGLVVLAEHVEPAQLSAALGLLTGALLPGVLQDSADPQHDRRRFSLVKLPDGSGWAVRGELDLECGERLWLLLRAELHRDPDSPLDTAAAQELREQGIDPYDPDLPSSTGPRSTGQKQHDALNNGLGRYLAADLGGTIGKQPVRIVVTVPAAALGGEPGTLPACTSSGTAVPAALLAQWACHSRLLRHVLSLAGKVLAISHTARNLSGEERGAQHTQTGGNCAGAGCRATETNPGVFLCPHHPVPFATSGTTSLKGSAAVCPSCHHDLHHGRRRLRLKDGRLL